MTNRATLMLSGTFSRPTVNGLYASATLLAGLVLAAVGGCARTPATPEPEPQPAPPAAPPPVAAPNRPAVPPPTGTKLPAVPHVIGPLAIKVVYPTPNAVVSARDSNFILGSLGNGDALLTINGIPVPVWPNGSFLAFLPIPQRDATTGADSITRRYDLVAIVGNDTARLTHSIRWGPAFPRDTTRPPDTLVPVPITPPTWALLGANPSPVNDTDRVIIGRPERTGVYKWFFIPGTPVQVTGYRGGYGSPPEPGARVRLDSGLDIWVARQDLTVQPAGYRPPAYSGQGTLTPQANWIDFTVRSAAPPAFLVDEGDQTITLTFYGATPGADSMGSDSVSDAYLASHGVSVKGSRVVHTFGFRGPLTGYLPFWENGVFTLRMRRPPVVATDDPLKGRTIVIDPGHPPGGATGPTGLWEPQATLAVGFMVRDLLAARGVNVIMTRMDMEAVDLLPRSIEARRANADAFVSIHLNALPDGMNPFTNQGTATYYFREQARNLARLTQQGLVEEMGLRDLGDKFGNFSVVRNTWMPSILCEGVFVIIPDQESAMRDPEFQRAYARGIVKGLERYFATLVPPRS